MFIDNRRVSEDDEDTDPDASSDDESLAELRASTSTSEVVKTDSRVDRNEAERQRRAAESLQLIANQAASFMAAALAAQQLVQCAAANFGIDSTSLSTLALLANQQQQSGSATLQDQQHLAALQQAAVLQQASQMPHLQQPQSPEQLVAAVMAASALLSPAGLGPAANHHLVPEDLTVNQPQHQQVAAAAAAMAASQHQQQHQQQNQHQHQQHQQQQTGGLLYGGMASALAARQAANGVDATSFQQANNFNKQLVAAVQSHLASQQQQQPQPQPQTQPQDQDPQHQPSTPIQPAQHPRQPSSGAAHSLIAHQRADRHLSGSLLVNVANGAAQNQNGTGGQQTGSAQGAGSPEAWLSHGGQQQSAGGQAPLNANSNHHTAYHRSHHHHLLGGHHHHSSIQTQQQLLATKGFNPMAVMAGSGQQTEILTPTHLRKAKLMFFYLRYPNSTTLKECFRDVRFGKNNMAQLVKWFSNFREFYYIQMEKFAREAVADERIQCKEDIVVNYDHELINVLNNHYNKNRHIELPEEFRRVVEETLRYFFEAIHQRRDQEQSWKKAIYKSIARLDQEVPARFKEDSFNECLE